MVRFDVIYIFGHVYPPARIQSTLRGIITLLFMCFQNYYFIKTISFSFMIFGKNAILIAEHRKRDEKP